MIPCFCPKFRLAQKRMKALDKCFGMLIASLLGTYLILAMRKVDIDTSSRSAFIQHLSNKVPMNSYRPHKALKRRAQRLQNVCKQEPELADYLPKQMKKSEFWRFTAYLKQEELSLLYCPVPKCGWSSWRSMFFDALYKEGDPTELLDDLSKTGWLTDWDKIGMTEHFLFDAKKITEESDLQHKMMFVRDPYDRLTSAYKDKALRDNGIPGFGGIYTKQFKSPCKWQTEDSPLLTFKQFVGCILEEVRETSGGDLEKFSAGEELDLHWRPQSLLCNVCAVNFNIIGHFEHMTEDMEEVLDVMKMDAKPQWDNKGDKKKKESLSKYYKQLTKQQIEDIQLLYNYDFQLFDYKKTFPL